MMLDLDELERRAKAAAAAGWIPADSDGERAGPHFISAATPAAVIVLIARLRAAEARAERLRAALESVGEQLRRIYAEPLREAKETIGAALAVDDAARGKGK